MTRLERIPAATSLTLSGLGLILNCKGVLSVKTALFSIGRSLSIEFEELRPPWSLSSKLAHWKDLVRHRESYALLLFFALASAFRFVPLLGFPRVGYDPFLHYQFSMALLAGKTTVVVVTQLGEHVTLYYPPLFHLLSLGFFFAFPTVDPYLVMKALVSVLDGLQIFPIYYTVKYVSKTSAGATVAALVAVVTPGDFKMISWGGYANIAGLLLLALLAYFVIKEKTVAVGILAATLFLTHHLSMVFAVALFLPYFLITWWKTKTLPMCLVAFCAAGGLAYIVFYWQALIPLYELYTNYAPRYAEFTMPANWPQMFSYPFLIFAAIGVGLWIYKTRTKFSQSTLILYMWFFLPLLLAYAYLFGVQWDCIRWIYFIQQPACIWSGIAVSQFKSRRLLLAVIMIAIVLEWIGTMQGYYRDISLNSGYAY